MNTERLSRRHLLALGGALAGAAVLPRGLAAAGTAGGDRQPRLELLYEADIELDAPQEIGATPGGNRTNYLIKKGTFQGPKMKGEILPGGGDWVTVRGDGVAALDIRSTLKTDDGKMIYLTARGYIFTPPETREKRRKGEKVTWADYYYRAAPFFETAAEKYAWLNRTLAVSVGEIKATGVGYTVYAIL